MSVVKLSVDERRIAIADLIAGGARPTIEDLTILYSVSRATIYRDLTHPYVLRMVREQVMDASKPQDIVDVMSGIRGLIRGGDSVTIRWYYEILNDINATKSDGKQPITAKEVLGITTNDDITDTDDDAGE